MKDWFLKLSLRERYMVGSAAFVVVVFLLYLLLWQPVANDYAKTKKNVAMAEETIAWMKDASHQVKMLRGSGGMLTNHQQGKQFILGLIDKTAKSAGLGAVLKRVQPEGDGGVKIWFEAASFDVLINWLDTLQSQHGLVVNEINVEQTELPGLVNVRLSLVS